MEDIIYWNKFQKLIRSSRTQRQSSSCLKGAKQQFNKRKSEDGNPTSLIELSLSCYRGCSCLAYQLQTFPPPPVSTGTPQHSHGTSDEPTSLSFAVETRMGMPLNPETEKLVQLSVRQKSTSDQDHPRKTTRVQAEKNKDCHNWHVKPLCKHELRICRHLG